MVDRSMALLRRLFVEPIRRAWMSCFSNLACLRSRASQQQRGRRSFAKLHRHVESCGYHDVHVMWSILLQQTTAIDSLSSSSSLSSPSSSPSSMPLSNSASAKAHNIDAISSSSLAFPTLRLHIDEASS